MFKRIVMGGLFLSALLCGGMATELRAQETAKSTLAAAGRKLKTAAGTKGDVRMEILRSARSIYAQVPARWRDESRAVAQAHLQMALLSRRMGDTKEAKKQLEAVVAVGGETARHATAYIEMSKMARQSKDLDLAVEKLQALLANCSECPRDCTDALLRMSSIYASQEQFEEATLTAQRVLDDYSGIWRANVDACNQLCRILIQRREWVKAIDQLQKSDQILKQRFTSHKAWDSVRRAMEQMSARRTLTPWSKDLAE